MLSALQNGLQENMKQIISGLEYDLNVSYTAPITIEGCADHATVRELEDLHKRMMSEFDSHLYQKLRNAGIRHKIRS